MTIVQGFHANGLFCIDERALWRTATVQFAVLAIDGFLSVQLAPLSI